MPGVVILGIVFIVCFTAITITCFYFQASVEKEQLKKEKEDAST